MEAVSGEGGTLTEEGRISAIYEHIAFGANRRWVRFGIKLIFSSKGKEDGSTIFFLAPTVC